MADLIVARPAFRSIEDAFYRRLVTAIVAARKAAGVRQADLAVSLGKPQSFVSKVEQLERRLDVGEYVAWTRAIGADPVVMLEAAIDAR